MESELRCPQCKSEESFTVSITGWATVSNGEIQTTRDFEYDNDSVCACNDSECDFVETVGAFKAHLSEEAR